MTSTPDTHNDVVDETIEVIDITVEEPIVANRPTIGARIRFALARRRAAEAAPPDRPDVDDAPDPGGVVLGAASEIPVRGGVIFPDYSVVVTQPTAGTFKAFSSICTHIACPCDRVESGKIVCPCHGATFSIKDGRVKRGPATDALPAFDIAVHRGNIHLLS
jgi:nitrite reductase/ring-hydroxylating ferredoxin subunit